MIAENIIEWKPARDIHRVLTEKKLQSINVQVNSPNITRYCGPMGLHAFVALI